MTDKVSGRVTLHTPADVLAAVPYLLGFHPTDSVVALALRRGQLVFAVRADLPGVGGPVGEVADAIGKVIAAHSSSAALVVGYGPAAVVNPAVAAVCAALSRRGIEVGEVLRVSAGRFWSYRCPTPTCCPADGTPYDVTGTEIAAVATYGGRVVLPDRAALRQSVAPPEGAELAAAERAAELAAVEFVATARSVVTNESAATGEPAVTGAASLVGVGLRAVTGALDRLRAGGRLTDGEVARLALLVAVEEVRDAASARVLAGGGASAEPDSDLAGDLELWREVVRRARPDLVAPAASLLALAAWRLGDGALGWVAVDRALDSDPGYPLARLIAEALATGLAPGALNAGLDQSRRTR